MQTNVKAQRQLGFPWRSRTRTNYFWSCASNFSHSYLPSCSHFSVESIKSPLNKWLEWRRGFRCARVGSAEKSEVAAPRDPLCGCHVDSSQRIDRQLRSACGLFVWGWLFWSMKINLLIHLETLDALFELNLQRYIQSLKHSNVNRRGWIHTMRLFRGPSVNVTMLRVNASNHLNVTIYEVYIEK